MAVTLNVQDYTGEVSDANAYISLADAKALFTARGLTTTASDDAISTAIISATEYIDLRFDFTDERLAEDQTTEFPRYAEEDEDALNEYIVKACGLYAYEALTASLWRTETETDAARVVELTQSVNKASETVKYSGALKNAQFKAFPLIDALVNKCGFLKCSGSIILRRI
jgi:hypothetical protein